MESGNPDGIFVVSGNNTELLYAASLAQKLSTSLTILIPKESPSTKQYSTLFGLKDGESPKERAYKRVKGLDIHKVVDVSIQTYDNNLSEFIAQISSQSLLVANDYFMQAFNVPVIASFGERVAFPYEISTILLPLGNDNTSIQTFREGIPFVNRISDKVKKIVFYHTTWKNSNVDSQLASDHVCDSAQSVISAAEECASKAGISYKTVIEAAEDVVDGIIETALRHKANLIVTARDQDTLFGDYCERLYSQPSPIPLMVLSVDRRVK